MSFLTRTALLLGLVLALGATSRSSFAATYYVDKGNPACTNSGGGTQGQPYCTISAAVSARSAAGNTIIVNPGVYREQITVAGSGTAAAPLVIQASGPGVIVDGAADFTNAALWVPFSGNVWRAASVAVQPVQVFADGARLRDSSTTTPSVLPTGRWHYISGQGLYANVGGANPATHDLQVGSTNYGFRLDRRSFVTIKGFEVRRSEAKGIYLTGPLNNVTLDGNTVRLTASTGVQASACSSLVIQKNLATECGDHGFFMITVMNSTFQDNEASYNYHPTIRRANGVNWDASSNNLIQRNNLHHNQDTGNNFTTNANNNVSLQNISWLNQDHGTDHTNCTGNVHIGDVYYRNYKDGFSAEGATPNHKVYNCIGIDNGMAVVGASLEYDLWVDQASSVGFVSDYNIWWNSDASVPPIKFIATKYPDVASFAAATGHDTHSLGVDPMFADTSAHDFHLRDHSPAIDAAITSIANWPSLDREGKPRTDDPSTPNTGSGPITYADRGAYEFTLNQPPTSALSVDPNNGLAPLPVIANASASSDPDGAISSYTFNFGDGTIVGPQSSPTANHTYALGEWVCLVTVTDSRGGTDTTAVPVVATPNLIVNGSFEANTTGWATGTSGTLARVSGGQDGAFAAQVTAPATGTATFVLNDSPNWITSTNGVNTRYRYTAWVRSLTHTGKAKLQVREFNANILQGTSVSPEITLNANWQLITVDHKSLMAGSTLDLNVVERPTVAGEIFQIDNLTARVVGIDRAPQVTAPATATVAEAQPISVQVTALDPDGEQIGLTADLTGLPAVNNAVFSVGAGNTSGTLTWTPTYKDNRATPYTVTFNAANILTGSATVQITVNNVDPPPVVIAPTQVNASEGVPLAFQVTSSDPDSSAIVIFAANVANLPAGHNAVFTPAPDNASGTFTWTPAFADGGRNYQVIFTATNSLSGSDTTTVTVGNVDLPPVVTAPTTFVAGEGAVSTLTVAAVDPDGQPITAFGADLSRLPAGNNAVFTVSPDKSSATLTWTPALATPPGPYTVIFTAANALTGKDTTDVLVNRKPVASAPATALVGETQPLSVQVTVTDADGDSISSLAANLTNLPAGHNAVFTPAADKKSGILTWTPTSNDGRSAPYSVTFTAVSMGLSASVTTLITVDQPPDVTAPALATVTETQALTLNVQANDPDNQPITALTADLTELPAGHNAVFTVAADKKSATLTWTPTANDGRIPPYHVTFTTTNALTGAATTTITVDQPPVVTVAPSAETNEAAPFVLDLSALDPDNQAIASLTANLSSLPVGHNAVFTPAAGNATARLTWTPTYNDSGTYVVSFTALNPLSSGAASITIHVSNVDRAPVMTAPVSKNVGEQDTLSVPVTVVDPDGDAIGSLTVDTTVLPAGHDAVFTVAADKKSGTLVWHPKVGDGNHAAYTMVFRATNAMIGTASTQVNVDRHPVVTAPTSVSVDENTEVVVNVSVQDPDGQAITSLVADLSPLPAGHNAVFTVAPDHLTGTLRWTPTYFDALGPYAIRFTGGNLTTGSAITSIAVVNFDRAPALDCPAVVIGGERTVISATVSSVDPDHEPITNLTADLSGLPSGSNAQFTPTPDKSGGTLTWTPKAGDGDGSPYVVLFSGSNAMEAVNATAIVVDRYPHVTAPATASVQETNLLSLSLSVGDPDFDEVSALTADLSELPVGNNAAFTPSADNSSATLTWTPTYDDARPQPYHVRFVARNALADTFVTAITVITRDRPPAVTVPINVLSGESSQMTITVQVSDPEGDPIDQLLADLTGLPGGNNATFTPATDKKSGVFRWTPTPAEAPGPYNVSFTAVANGLSFTSTVVVRVDRRPVFTLPATDAAVEAAPYTLNVTVADPDNDAIATLTANLSALPAGNNAVFTASADKKSGTLTWTPTYNDSGGPFIIPFTASNALTTGASISIRVANTDRAPVVAASDSILAAENVTLSLPVTVTDLDSDAIGSLSVNLGALPPGNDAVFTANPGNTSGTLTWKPQSGDARAQTYDVVFSAGNVLTGTHSTKIKVDQRPVLTITPSNLTIGEGTLASLSLSVADPDGQPINSLTANLSGLPAGHNAVFTPSADKTSGTLTWTPGYFDSRVAPYTITFTASNTLSSAAATTIKVNNVDRAPVVTAPATLDGVGGTPITVNVTAADADNEPIGTLSADLSAIPSGSNATFTENANHLGGILTWTPNASVPHGPFRVVFMAANALPGTANLDFTIDQRPVVTAPASQNGSEAAEIAFDVTASDFNGDAIAGLTANFSGLPAGNTATFTPNANRTSGHFSWTPSFFDAGGPYNLVLTAANALSGTATVALNVANVDRAPVITSPATRTTPEGAPFSIIVSVADPDGEPLQTLTADLTGLPAGNNATFTENATHTGGTFSWMPTFNDAGGPYNVTFRSSNAMVVNKTTAITVTNSDRPPVISGPASLQVGESSLVSLTVTASDPDGQPINFLTADLVGLPAGGNATFVTSADKSSGTLTWTPTFNDGRLAAYNLTFTAFNGLAGTFSTAITVTDDNRAPTVTVPAAVSVNENALISLNVTAVDSDGEAISTLAADLSEFPAANKPVFTVNAAKTAGTFTWTPNYSDGKVDAYHATFTASNSSTGGAVSFITVNNVDRAPVVTAPASASGIENTTITFNVTVTDPDGDPMSGLTADLSSLPPGSTATFTANAAKTSGTFTWVPPVSAVRATPYPVVFTASNGMTTTGTTAVTVGPSNATPHAALTATPDAVVAPAVVTLSAAGSTDSDGSIASYTFVFGDGQSVGPQAGATSTHLYTSGTWTAKVIVVDNKGARDSATVAVGGTLTNLVANPSFDTNTTGWATSGSVTLSRVTTTPHSGSGCLSLKGSSSASAVFGTSSSPNTVTSVAGVGRKYRFGAWVRSASFTGSVGLEVREFTGTTTQRGVTTKSAPATLSPTWQYLTVDYVVTTAGTNLNLRAIDTPNSASQTWFLDDVTIALIPGTPQAPVVTGPAQVSALENAPIVMNVSASAPDGRAITTLSASFANLPAGHNAVFTPNATKTAGTLTWTPKPADVRVAPYNVTFTAANTLSGTWTTAIGVADSAAGTNLATNSGFETNTTGWTTSGTVTLTRITTGQRTGTACLRLVGGTSATAAFGGTDNPNYVATVAGVGRRYRFGSWVKGLTATDTGSVQIELREFSGTTTQVGVTTKSNAVRLTMDWQYLGVDYTVTTAGTNLDIRVIDTPKKASETFLLDDVNAVLMPSGPPPDQAPVVTATPATTSVVRSHPVTVNISVADPDGQAINSLAVDMTGLPAGNNATFTKAADNKTATFTWTPKPADIRATPYNVILTAANALTGTSTLAFTVIDSATTVNLAGNSGFETDLTGWGAYGSATVTRVAGGHSGGFAIQSVGSSSFGIDDIPDWVTSVPGVGAHYRIKAWVRSASNTGQVKIRVYEFQGTTQQGTTVYSQVVALSPTWQQLVADYNTLKAGSSLSIRVTDAPVSGTETFLVDDVSIELIPAGTAVLAASNTDDAVSDRSVTSRAFATEARSFAIDGDAATWSLQIEGVDGPVFEGAMPHVALRYAGRELTPTAIVLGDDHNRNAVEEIFATFGGAELRRLLETAPADARRIPVTVEVAGRQGEPKVVSFELDVDRQPLVFGATFAPNPFRVTGTLAFTITRRGPVRADIFDVNGRRVRMLMDESDLKPGRHSIPIDAQDERRGRMLAGVYFYRIEAREGVLRGRFVLTR